MQGTEPLGTWEQTPQLSEHARERCAQMGITTKVAKRIWKTRTLIRGAREGCLLVTSTEVPEYAIVVDENGWLGGPPVVVTVLFRCYEEYVRDGETYRVVS
jgi:hypothetical protein